MHNSLYNVDSPGGYQLTGMSIPCIDILGTKRGYTTSKPWLYEDFDQITFYPVTEAEYEEELALFNSGRYEYKYEEAVFDMAEHNKLLRETAEEVRVQKEKQRVSQMEMDRIESHLMSVWEEEKKTKVVPVGEIEGLLNGKFGRDYCFTFLYFTISIYTHLYRASAYHIPLIFQTTDPEIHPIEAPLTANVWKIQIQPGDVIKAGQVLTILEAMKLEIAVHAEPEVDGASVEKILIKPNDVVEAGKSIILVRMKRKKARTE